MIMTDFPRAIIRQAGEVFFVAMETRIVSIEIERQYGGAADLDGPRSPMAVSGCPAPQLLVCRLVRGHVDLISLPIKGGGCRYYWGSETEEARAAALPRGSAEWILDRGVQSIYGFDEAVRDLAEAEYERLRKAGK